MFWLLRMSRPSVLPSLLPAVSVPIMLPWIVLLADVDSILMPAALRP